MPDVPGKYDVRTIARMHHDGECDASIADALGTPGPHTEELAEVMDPEGTTIAYFTEAPMAERFCAWMNSQPQTMPTAPTVASLRARYELVGSGTVPPSTDNYLAICAAIRKANAVEQCADWLRPDHLAILRQCAATGGWMPKTRE